MGNVPARVFTKAVTPPQTLWYSLNPTCQQKYQQKAGSQRTLMNVKERVTPIKAKSAKAF
jgi:hypothetical protein